MKKGSREEDNYLRPLNHFHNPLKSWPAAGLNDLLSGESSLVWSQDYKNESSWKSARDNFYYALTSRSKSTRDSYFANMFKTLGQVMHLVQDCASPAHVRNDAHPLRDSLEKWVNYNTEISLVVFPTVDTSVAPYGFDPVTQFFDTDQYNGSNPSVYSDQGLAEYTNTNFASDDTTFTETFNPSNGHYQPLPRRADMQEYAENVGNGYVRIYFKKIQNGEVIEHFAAAGRLYRVLEFWPSLQRYCLVLDDACNRDYAQKLLPRAAGYSAGLLNYFFRGNIVVVAAEDSEHEFQIVNDFCEDMEGVFEIYYTDDNLERTCVWRGSYALGSNRSGNNKSLNFTFDKPPTDAEQSARFMVVFIGRLGSESNAVVAGNVGFCSDELYISITCNGITPKFSKQVKLIDADGREHIATSSSDKPYEVGPFKGIKFPATMYLFYQGYNGDLFSFWTRSSGSGCLYVNQYEHQDQCHNSSFSGKTVMFSLSSVGTDGICIKRVEWKKGPTLSSTPKQGDIFDFSGLKVLQYSYVHQKTWEPWVYPLPPVSCLYEPHIEEMNKTNFVPYVVGEFTDCFYRGGYSYSNGCGEPDSCYGCGYYSNYMYGWDAQYQSLSHNAVPANRFISSDENGEAPSFNQVNILVSRHFEFYKLCCESCSWNPLIYSMENFDVEDWEKYEFKMVNTPADFI